MAHQCLHRRHIFTVRLEQRTEPVSERMPADPFRNPGSLRCRTDVILQSTWAGEPNSQAIFGCFANYPLTQYLALWLNIVVWCSDILFRELTRMNRCLPR